MEPSETCHLPLCQLSPPNPHLCFYLLMADHGTPSQGNTRPALGGVEDPSLPALVTCALFHLLPPPTTSAGGPSFPAGFDALSPPPPGATEGAQREGEDSISPPWGLLRNPFPYGSRPCRDLAGMLCLGTNGSLRRSGREAKCSLAQCSSG